MSRARTYFRRILFGLGCTILIVALLVTVYVRSKAFGKFLGDRANAFLAATFRGPITLGKVEPSSWGTIVIHNLTIGSGGSPILQIPEVHLSYALAPLLWREAKLEITAVDPIARLETDSNDQWNLITALAQRSPARNQSSSSGYAINLDRVTILGGTVDAAPKGTHGPHYRLEGISLDAELLIKSEGIKVWVNKLQTALRAPAMPPVDLSTVLLFDSVGAAPRLKLSTLELQTQLSSLSVTGVVDDIRTFDNNLTISVKKLSPPDLAQILHNYPLREDVSGQIELKGNRQSLHAKVTLASGTAQLNADLHGGLTKTSPFDGSLKLANFDLGRLKAPNNLAGVLDVSAIGHGSTTNPRMLDSTISLSGNDVRVNNIVLGALSINSFTRNGIAKFNGNLQNGKQRLELTGDADATRNLNYHAVLSMNDFNVATVNKSAPVSNLNGRVKIGGGGDSLQTANVGVSIVADKSEIARVPLNGIVDAHLVGGVISILQAKMASQGSAVNLKGQIGVVRGSTTRVSYEMNVERLAPWMRLTGMAGDGVVKLNGTAVGTLTGAHGPLFDTAGTLMVRDAHLSNASVSSVQAGYQFARIGTMEWPQGAVQVQLNTLQLSRTKIRSISSRAETTGGRTLQASISSELRDNRNNIDRVSTTLVYRPNYLAGRIDVLSVMLPDGTWQLAGPAQFFKDPRGVGLKHFKLANGPRELAVEGSLTNAGAQDATIRARAIDLDLLQPFLPADLNVTGDLSVDASISGTSVSPSATTSWQGHKLAANGTPLGDLEIAVRYASDQADVDATLRQNPQHQLNLAGRIPIKLSWMHGLVATVGNNEDVRLQSAGIDLAPFASLAPQTIKQTGGLFVCNLILSGPLFHPLINGSVAINGGHGELVPLGVTVTDIETRLIASPTQIQIVQLSARSAGGSLSTNGSVALQQDYSPGAINVTLRLQRWPAIATQQYHAKLDGQIHAGGTPQMPKILGNLDVYDTVIRPDLSFLGGSSAPPPDDTILIIQPGQQLPSSSNTSPIIPNNPRPPSGTNQILNNLELNLTINLHRNNWIRHEDAEIEMDGHLALEKHPGEALSIIGEIDTVRGWLQYHNKRFNLASGQVLFTGGHKVNPTLDIDAQNTIGDYTVDVIVTGTAEKPQIKLDSQPQLAQADILSLILFGSTTSQLTQGQGNALQQQAQSMALGAAGEALSQSLGLESMGVDVNGTSVGLGRYIGENTYVSISPNLSANTTSTPSQVASIQYFLRRWLTITSATMSDGSRQIFINLNKQY